MRDIVTEPIVLEDGHARATGHGLGVEIDPVALDDVTVDPRRAAPLSLRQPPPRPPRHPFGGAVVQVWRRTTCSLPPPNAWGGRARPRHPFGGAVVRGVVARDPQFGASEG
ncbi:MAG: hypothetical protein R2723_12070 [Microbacterium sp.]